MPEKKLGFIGLGEMGKPMVKNLVNAGYTVTVWNRSQPGIDECMGYGAAAGTSPKDVAEKSDIVFTMVIASEDVRQVALGENGIIEGAHPGLILIDTSTISPKVSKEVADKLVQADIKGILNFAPEPIHCPNEIYVEDIDMTMSLEKVAYFARNS